MSPFLYLQTRRVKNAIRRSLKTPVRGFITVLVIGYFFALLSMTFSLKGPKVEEWLPSLDFHFPLALLTLVHLLPLLYSILPPKYLYMIFSETDIANLYQAPLRRWEVFRYFFISRAFAGFCLIFVIIAFYGSWTLHLRIPGIFAHANDGSRFFWNIFYVAMILPALAGILFWRFILDIRREFKLIPGYPFRVSIVVFLGSIATCIGYSLVQAYAAGASLQAGLVQSIESLPLSVMLGPFRLFAQLFLLRADLDSDSFWICVVFWLSLAASGYYVLRSQNLLLYDYASRLTEFRAKMVAQMRSPAERLKEMKQSGKKVLRLPWFARMMHPRKAGAIFWLDMIITWRSYGPVIRGLRGVLFLAVIAGWAVMQYYGFTMRTSTIWSVSTAAMFMASWGLLTVSIIGFSDVLRRVEIQKPIPLSALQTVTMHVLQWTAMSCSVTLVPFCTAFILLGSASYPILFVLVAGWSFMHCMISGIFLICLYNPDLSDPIQRMYASTFGFLLSIGASIPGATILVVTLLSHTPLIIALGLVIFGNLASAALLHHLSAYKYLSFAPTD